MNFKALALGSTLIVTSILGGVNVAQAGTVRAPLTHNVTVNHGPVTVTEDMKCSSFTNDTQGPTYQIATCVVPVNRVFLQMTQVIDPNSNQYHFVKWTTTQNFVPGNTVNLGSIIEAYGDPAQQTVSGNRMITTYQGISFTVTIN